MRPAIFSKIKGEKPVRLLVKTPSDFIADLIRNVVSLPVGYIANNHEKQNSKRRQTKSEKARFFADEV